MGSALQAHETSSPTPTGSTSATYWGIGRRIVEEEEQQHGAARAEYGKELITRLSTDLTGRFGRGFGRRNVFQMRAFYLAYRGQIVQTASAQSPTLEAADKVQILSALSGVHPCYDGADGGAPIFPLPWSHYVRLLSVKNLEARRFYEGEALRADGTFANSGTKMIVRDVVVLPARFRFFIGAPSCVA